MSCLSLCISRALFFFFTDPPTTETYTLSLHDALPISSGVVVAQVPGATGLTAYAGHVVWSQPDPATGRWRLMQWHDGRVTRLAVGSRRVSFDADAGPDARGHPVVVYSRCRHEPPYVYYTA